MRIKSSSSEPKERKVLNVAEIVARFCAGENVKELAKRFRVTHVTILKRLRATGVIDDAVARIQKASPLNRKAAILLFKRCGGDVARAVQILRENQRQASSVIQKRRGKRSKAAVSG